MKSNKVFAAAVLAIAGFTSAGAFSQSTQSAQYGEAALVVAPAAFTSNVTRAQIESAHIQARQNGAVAVSHEGAFAGAPATTSALSRADVQAEAGHYVIMDGSNRKIYR